jgi:hypothetical protein
MNVIYQNHFQWRVNGKLKLRTKILKNAPEPQVQAYSYQGNQSQGFQKKGIKKVKIKKTNT